VPRKLSESIRAVLRFQTFEFARRRSNIPRAAKFIHHLLKSSAINQSGHRFHSIKKTAIRAVTALRY
jgi:hypothetical protein